MRLPCNLIVDIYINQNFTLKRKDSFTYLRIWIINRIELKQVEWHESCFFFLRGRCKFTFEWKFGFMINQKRTKHTLSLCLIRNKTLQTLSMTTTDEKITITSSIAFFFFYYYCFNWSMLFSFLGTDIDILIMMRIRWCRLFINGNKWKTKKKKNL